MTYRFFIYDILESFKQTFDDKDISINHVIYWTQLGINRLKRLDMENNDTGLYLNIFDTVSVVIDTALKDRKYVVLPAMAFGLKNEKAVKYITYNFDTGCCCDGPNFAQVFFNRTTAQKSHRLYMDPYEHPSSENPYFYRAKDRLYLLGLECINVSDVEIGLMSALDPTEPCDMDTEIELSNDLLAGLRADILEMGGLALIVPKDRVNEGADMATEKGGRVFTPRKGDANTTQKIRSDERQ